MKSALLPFALFTFAATSGAFDLPASLAKKLMGDQDSKSSANNGYGGESIDNSIDPDTYIVGGGDAYQIAIVGLPSQEYLCTINSDGNIYIADVGEIKLGRISLTQSIQKIRDAFRGALKNRYQVYVALKKAKRPVVTVMGAVSGPGTYHMEGTQRLLDAVKIANDGRLPSYGEVNLRRVESSSGDSVRTYDLLKYLAGKDPSQNPYLYPGDAIEIRPLDLSICVAGPVSGPIQGRLPLVPGETAAELLSMLTLKSSADSAYFLYRKAGEPARKVPRAEAASVKLGDNDVLTVPSIENFGTQDTVYVSGEVARPGTYPIVWGKTTAAELLDFAGGPTSSASPQRAFVIRANKIIQPGASYLPAKNNGSAQSIKSGIGGTTQAVRPEINSSLSDLISNNDYAVIRLSEFGKGSVTLESGDELHVPRKETLVYVSGYVKNPGAYPYTPGESASHYIDLAKGYSNKADKPNQLVMTHYKGITQLRDTDHVDEGDVIVVPASIENKRLTTVYLPVFQTLVSILSLAITVAVLTK